VNIRGLFPLNHAQQLLYLAAVSAFRALLAIPKYPSCCGSQCARPEPCRWRILRLIYLTSRVATDSEIRLQGCYCGRFPAPICDGELSRRECCRICSVLNVGIDLKPNPRIAARVGRISGVSCGKHGALIGSSSKGGVGVLSPTEETSSSIQILQKTKLVKPQHPRDTRCCFWIG
jgi:hypothetical protein